MDRSPKYFFECGDDRRGRMKLLELEIFEARVANGGSLSDDVETSRGASGLVDFAVHRVFRRVQERSGEFHVNGRQMNRRETEIDRVSDFEGDSEGFEKRFVFLEERIVVLAFAD